LISINYTFENGTPTFSYNKNMKLVYTLLVAFVLNTVYSQPTDAYFEKIRNNEAQLTAFFSQMRKGGDYTTISLVLFTQNHC
jgi:hypothetical protein